MTTPTSQRRSFRPTPTWLIFGLLVVEGLLWLSNRYRWFWFNEKKGWTVLIAVASVAVVFVAMLLWLVVALVFRWRFQFSIRSLLVLTVAVALPCGWLSVEIQAAKRHAAAVAAINKPGRLNLIDEQLPPVWLRSLLGDHFFGPDVELARFFPDDGDEPTDSTLDNLKELSELQRLFLYGNKVTDAGMKNLKGLNHLRIVCLRDTAVTDAGLENLNGLNQLSDLDLGRTEVTDTGLTRLVKGTSKLRSLCVSATRITDVGLESLKGQQELWKTSELPTLGCEALRGWTDLHFYVLTTPQSPMLAWMGWRIFGHSTIYGLKAQQLPMSGWNVSNG